MVAKPASRVLTFLSATRSKPDAAVSYYGGRSNEFVGELAGMATPLMMHLAGADQDIPKPAQEIILSAAAARDNVQVFVYPGREHAFARVNGQHFDAEAAALSWELGSYQFDLYKARKRAPATLVLRASANASSNWPRPDGP